MQVAAGEAENSTVSAVLPVSSGAAEGGEIQEGFPQGVTLEPMLASGAGGPGRFSQQSKAQCPREDSVLAGVDWPSVSVSSGCRDELLRLGTNSRNFLSRGSRGWRCQQVWLVF